MALYKHYKNIIIISLVFLASFTAKSQNSYEMILATPDDDVISFVYNDHSYNEQVFVHSRYCVGVDSNCMHQNILYSLNSDGDTTKLPFNNQSNDTLFEIQHIIGVENGDYFLTGIAWTPDSNSNLRYESDYNLKWNSDREIVWESITNRSSHNPIDSLSVSSNFKILKLINGNYLVVKSTFTLEPYVVLRYFLQEIDKNTGEVVKEKLSHQLSSYVQGLTYNHDSSNILLHIGRTWLNECKRNSCGVFILDTAAYDTVNSFCYNRDDDDPYKYWCVHVPYNALLNENGNLILSGTGDCSTVSGPGEDYLFIYEYDTAFQLINSAFYTDPDTIYDAGWYESMAFTNDNGILFAGNHDRMQIPFSSYYNYIYLAKVNSDLKLISERYIGGDAEYIVHSMDATNDGGMIVTGTRYDFMTNEDEHDAFIIKTDANLWVHINDHSNIDIHSALVYPNPGSDALTLQTTEHPSQFKLLNAQGQMLYEQEINDRLTSISTSPLPAGIYIWTLQINNAIIDRGKWIKY